MDDDDWWDDEEPQVMTLTSEQAEKADYVVCVEWTNPPMFSDNLKGTCVACGKAVQFRPTSPKKPPRLCMRCAAEMSGPKQ